MDCYAGFAVFVRPWFGRLLLGFHLIFSFRRIYLYLRFYLILCFGRMYLRCIFSSGFISSLNFGRIYLVSFFLEKSLWTYILASRISFVHAYFSFLWVSLNEYTKIKDSNNILENTSYIYIFENPNLCKHSSTDMAHAHKLMPYWIKNTNQLVHE